jgi:transcriptional regulator with XRE-family HTH domain
MSRFSQMLDVELKRRGKSERELAREFGWSQQAFNTWKTGGIPRQQFYQRIGDFLRIPIDDVAMLLDEARESTGNTKLPKMDPIYGKVTDRKEGKYSFPDTDAAGVSGMRYPLTRYAIRIDTKIMEPALLVGTKAWADPSLWPKVGNEVIVHSKGGNAWLGRLAALENGDVALLHYSSEKKIVVRDVEAVHVIALAERVAGAGTAA